MLVLAIAAAPTMLLATTNIALSFAFSLSIPNTLMSQITCLNPATAASYCPRGHARLLEAAGADAEDQVQALRGGHSQERVSYAVKSVTEPVRVLSGICHKLER